MTLYIFTPTFNRAMQLSKLYESLCRQTIKDFIWLVVDDGSSDETCELIQNFIKESKLSIQYVYQKNGGKHTAYNKALDLMDTDGYHICVDSDDYLFESAVEKFHKGISSIQDDDSLVKYIGVVYPKTFLDSETVWLPSTVRSLNIPDTLFKYHLSVETAIVIKNQYIGSFRFKKFKDENFLSEETLYYYLAEKGLFYPIKENVYCAEYLDNGLTKNLFLLWQKNYYGTIHSLEARYNYISSHINGISKIKGLMACQMNIQALKLTRVSLASVIKNAPFPWLLPLSYIWKHIRFKHSKIGRKL